MISATVLAFQIALSFGLIFAMRGAGWPVAYQAAGVAVALMVALAAGSLVKASFLSRLLGASVNPLRWPLVWAALAAIVVGWGFTELPKRLEWAELSIGIPAIVGVYGYVLWRWAFKDEDRALFRKGESSVPEMA